MSDSDTQTPQMGHDTLVEDPPGKAQLVAEGTFGGESQEFITDPVPAGAPDGMGELADEDVTEGVMLKISTSSCMLRSVMVARSTKETEVAGAAPHGSGS